MQALYACFMKFCLALNSYTFFLKGGKKMDQQKIGSFLKGLRQEKKLTQDQLAEHLSVSRRTVSRWETGSNLPDLSVLVELADFYNVDLTEIFHGERRNETMDAELKDTLLQAADYTRSIKEKIIRRMHLLFIIGCISFIFYLSVLFFGPEQTSAFFDFIKGMSLGIAFGMVVVGTIMTSKYADKIVEWKVKHNILSE